MTTRPFIALAACQLAVLVGCDALSGTGKSALLTRNAEEEALECIWRTAGGVVPEAETCASIPCLPALDEAGAKNKTMYCHPRGEGMPAVCKPPGCDASIGAPYCYKIEINLDRDQSDGGFISDTALAPAGYDSTPMTAILKIGDVNVQGFYTESMGNDWYGPDVSNSGNDFEFSGKYHFRAPFIIENRIELTIVVGQKSMGKKTTVHTCTSTGELESTAGWMTFGWDDLQDTSMPYCKKKNGQAMFEVSVEVNKC